VQTPHPRLIEVAAHLTQGGRSRAAAILIVQRNGQWQATALTIALQSDHISQADQICQAGAA